MLKRIIKSLFIALAGAVVLCALLIGFASTNVVVRADDKENQGNDSGDFPPGAHGGTHQRGFGKPGGGSTVLNLLDHGGPILLPPTNFHFVWWGSPAAFGSEQPILQNFVGGLGGITLFMMMDQYTRSSAVVGLSYPSVDFTDSSAPPAHGPSVSTIVNEVCSATNGQVDKNAIYAVLTSNFPKGANYCAWHSSGTCNGVNIKVIYQPNPANVWGCSTGVYPNNNQQADSTANTLSHEIFETVTDPNGSAWFDQNGAEIGDKCAWTFNPGSGQSYTNTIGSLNYYIQQEWSNLASGCVQN